MYGKKHSIIILNYMFILEKTFIKLQEKIQLSWKANHRFHQILKAQVYHIQFLLLIMTLIFSLLLENELEHVLNTLLPTLYPTINYLKIIRPLVLKSLINLCKEMFRRLLVSKIRGQRF